MSDAPLSEDVEKLIAAVSDGLAGRMLVPMVHRSWLIDRLRAFAREIQEPLETRLEDVYVKDSCKTREINILVPECRRLESALLASQERCRALSGALMEVVDWQGIDHVGDCPGDDTCECPLVEKVNSAIRAYRSSEAGRGAE